MLVTVKARGALIVQERSRLPPRRMAVYARPDGNASAPASVRRFERRAVVPLGVGGSRHADEHLHIVGCEGVRGIVGRSRPLEVQRGERGAGILGETCGPGRPPIPAAAEQKAGQ